MEGFAEYIGAPAGEATVLVSVGKVMNGYQVVLATRPKRKPVRPMLNPLAGMDPDEAIDRMVDTFGAFLRTIHDKGAGEDWKDGHGGDRQLIRDGFKAFLPHLAVSGYQTADESTELPRHETMVFGTKEQLMKYLDENL